MFKKIIKRILICLVGLGLIFILLNAMFLAYTTWLAYQPLMTKKFDGNEWKLAEKKVWQSEFKLNGQVIQSGLDVALERRCGMYHDLTRNHLKKGMSIQEIEDLLGPITHWFYYENDKQKCASYGMGICYSNALSMVPMSLFTCFNKKGKLISYDREEHGIGIGLYNIKTQEQICGHENEDGTVSGSNDCGIIPW